MACHPAYDLVSALQDARRDVDPGIEAACIARYLAATGLDPDRFRAAYALLGAQRNLRIMGIFTRLCLRDGKDRYLSFMPRVWGYVQRNLTHPALAPLAGAATVIAGCLLGMLRKPASALPGDEGDGAGGELDVTVTDDLGERGAQGGAAVVRQG